MRFLIKKTPDNFIKSVNDEISSILNKNFNSLFPEFANYECNTEKFSMPVELHENEKDYCIKAELPGIKKEDVDIDLDKNYIIISAKKEEEKCENEKHFKKSEFRYGEFSRTVYFPEEIDTEKTSAKLEYGILKITAPKKEEKFEHSKKLSIQ